MVANLGPVGELGNMRLLDAAERPNFVESKDGH